MPLERYSIQDHFPGPQRNSSERTVDVWVRVSVINSIRKNYAKKVQGPSISDIFMYQGSPQTIPGPRQSTCYGCISPHRAPRVITSRSVTHKEKNTHTHTHTRGFQEQRGVTHPVTRTRLAMDAPSWVAVSAMTRFSLVSFI